VSQIIKKISFFYGTVKFINILKRSPPPVPALGLDEFSPHLSVSLRSVLKLPRHTLLDLPSGFFLKG